MTITSSARTASVVASVMVLLGCVGRSGDRAEVPVLAGRTFTVARLEVDGAEVPLPAHVEVQFGPSSTLSGGEVLVIGACNRGGTSYVMRGSALVLAGPFAATAMGCEKQLLDQDELLFDLVRGQPDVGPADAGILVTTARARLALLDADVA